MNPKLVKLQLLPANSKWWPQGTLRNYCSWLSSNICPCLANTLMRTENKYLISHDNLIDVTCSNLALECSLEAPVFRGFVPGLSHHWEVIKLVRDGSLLDEVISLQECPRSGHWCCDSLLLPFLPCHRLSMTLLPYATPPHCTCQHRCQAIVPSSHETTLNTWILSCFFCPPCCCDKMFR